MLRLMVLRSMRLSTARTGPGFDPWWWKSAASISSAKPRVGGNTCRGKGKGEQQVHPRGAPLKSKY